MSLTVGRIIEHMREVRESRDDEKFCHISWFGGKQAACGAPNNRCSAPRYHWSEGEEHGRCRCGLRTCPKCLEVCETFDQLGEV